MRTHDAREAHIDCVYKKTEESLVNSNGRDCPLASMHCKCSSENAEHCQWGNINKQPDI